MKTLVFLALFLVGLIQDAGTIEKPKTYDLKERIQKLSDQLEEITDQISDKSKTSFQVEAIFKTEWDRLISELPKERWVLEAEVVDVTTEAQLQIETPEILDSFRRAYQERVLNYKPRPLLIQLDAKTAGTLSKGQRIRILGKPAIGMSAAKANFAILSTIEQVKPGALIGRAVLLTEIKIELE